MAVVMEALDGCFLDRPVHPFNLTVRPRMIGFRQTMFNPMSCAAGGIEEPLIDVLGWRFLRFGDLIDGFRGSFRPEF